MRWSEKRTAQSHEYIVLYFCRPWLLRVNLSADNASFLTCWRRHIKIFLEISEDFTPLPRQCWSRKILMIHPIPLSHPSLHAFLWYTLYHCHIHPYIYSYDTPSTTVTSIPTYICYQDRSKPCIAFINLTSAVIKIPDLDCDLGQLYLRELLRSELTYWLTYLLRSKRFVASETMHASTATSGVINKDRWIAHISQY